MRARLQEHAFGRGRFGVRTQAHPRLRKAKLDVVLAHQEVRRAHAGIVLDDQVEHRLLARGAALTRDLGQRAAGQRLERRVVELDQDQARSEEHTSELQSLMRISYAVFCLTKNTHQYY